MTLPPSDPGARGRNLAMLSAMRRGHFPQVMHPILTGTRLHFISEQNRIPAVEAIFPLVLERQQGVLRFCINAQKDRPWNLGPGVSPWHSLRVGQYTAAMAEHDDLTSLDYGGFFDGLEVPSEVNRDKLLASIEDYLVNDSFVLECPRLIGESQRALDQESLESSRGRALSFEQLRIHLHSTTAIVRLRAGWDKQLNNVLRLWFGPHEGKWPNEWPKRILRLDLQMPAQPPQTISFWEDWKRNATEIAEDRGLRRLRDNDLHYWSVRTRETFGYTPSDLPLDELVGFVVVEHFRLVDAWLLTLAMIRSSAAAADADQPVKPGEADLQPAK